MDVGGSSVGQKLKIVIWDAGLIFIQCMLILFVLVSGVIAALTIKKKLYDSYS